MATHKDAIKKDRQSKKQRLSNRANRSAMRTEIKKAREAIGNGNSENAATVLRSAQALLHKLARKGVIHSNTADRQISQLAKALNGIQG